MSDITDDELRDYAATLITEAAREVESLTVWEASWEYEGFEGFDDDDFAKVYYYMSRARVTVVIDDQGYNE